MKNNSYHNIENLQKKLKKYKTLTFVFVGFFSCALIILIFTLHKNIKVKSFPLLDPARAYLTPENYLINIQSLREYMQGLEMQYGDSISMYYEQINSGSNISVNKDVHLFPASLSKLAQAIIISKKVEEKVLTWDQKLKILPEDISSDSGTLYQRVEPNSLVSVEELLKELLVNSDNTAQNVFRRYLSVNDYLDFQDETGLQDLYNEKGYISAKEYTRILRVLYVSSYLEPENSQKILEYMSQSTFKDYLSQGIPSDVKFAHKYGENFVESIFADSGIVYVPGRPYMLTVIVKGEDSTLETREKIVKLMKDISEHAYQISK